MSSQAITASIFLHGAVFLAGGAFFVSEAQYGVEARSGGIELELVAAPDSASIPEPIFEEPSEDEAAQPVEAVPAPAAELLTPRGDGSSIVPGQDQTTLHSSVGAVVEARPAYLKNPAPTYPDEARRQGQEGVVLLSVDVDSSGRVNELNIKQSSGYALLDDSAVRAVRRWRFEPARVGSLTLDSKVEIPVRFQLEEKE